MSKARESQAVNEASFVRKANGCADSAFALGLDRTYVRNDHATNDLTFGVPELKLNFAVYSFFISD
jgi:hypothetical protein